MGHPDQVVERRPPWLKVRLPSGPGYAATLHTARERNLHTVCEDARCPNIAECWGRKTATFMILGNICTRACGFCSVATGRPTEYDTDEPRRTAEAIRDLGIHHAVITSVARDDRPDGGAWMFAETIRQTRALCPGTTIEILTPDFRGEQSSLESVWAEKPEVFAHNIECVPRLDKRVRKAAFYARSMTVLRLTRHMAPECRVKTGVMVGHGEAWDELLRVMDDLATIPVDILTIGQYLQPTKQHLPVQRFYTPAEFEQLADEGRKRGIPYVFSGPLVRSSYRAEEALKSLPLKPRATSDQR